MLLNAVEYYPGKVLFLPDTRILPDQESQVTGHIESTFIRSPLDFRQQPFRHRDGKTAGRSHAFFLFSHLLRQYRRILFHYAA